MKNMEEKRRARKRELQEEQIQALNQKRVMKSQERKKEKSEEKQKYIKDIHVKQLRLKAGIRELKKVQKDGIPRYDLHTHDLSRLTSLRRVKEEGKSKTPSHKSPVRKSIVGGLNAR